MGGYTYSLKIDVLEQRKLPIKEHNIKSYTDDSKFKISNLPSTSSSFRSIDLRPFTISNIEVESYDTDIPAYNEIINNVQEKLGQLKIIQEKVILERIERHKTQSMEFKHTNLSDKPLDNLTFKSSVLSLEHCDLETRKKILTLKKQVITCVNVVAGTISQIKRTSDAISKIISEAKMSSEDIYSYILYTIIDCIFNCCEPGGQIYIKPSSVWPFSHLLSLVLREPIGIKIYHSIVIKRNLNQIFKIGDFDDQDKSIKFNGKSLDALVRLHISLFVLAKDYNSIWSWFASTVNEYTLLPNGGLYIPIVLLASLEIAGHFALATFRGQFIKIVRLINDNLMSKIKKYIVLDDTMKATYKMYRERFEHLINEFIKYKKFDIPQGYEMKHREEKLHANI